MTLCSIDPGSRSLGYAVWKDGVLIEADYLVIDESKPSAVLGYIVAFFDAYHETERFDAMVTERQFTSMQFGGGANSAVLKCIPIELECWANERGVGFAMLAPATIKKAITGHGVAEKSKVCSYVQHLWPKLAEIPKGHRHDVSDAIAVGVAAMKCGTFSSYIKEPNE